MTLFKLRIQQEKGSLGPSHLEIHSNSLGKTSNHLTFIDSMDRALSCIHTALHKATLEHQHSLCPAAKVSTISWKSHSHLVLSGFCLLVFMVDIAPYVVSVVSMFIMIPRCKCSCCLGNKGTETFRQLGQILRASE